MNAFNNCLVVLTLKYFLLLLLGTWVLSLITWWRWIAMSINFLALFHIRKLNRIGQFLDFDACHNAVRALILSKLDYCSCLLNGLTQKTRLHRILKGVQSSSSRTQTYSCFSSATRPSLASCLSTYQISHPYTCLYNLFPAYISSLLRGGFKTQPSVDRRFRPVLGGCHCLEQ